MEVFTLHKKCKEKLCCLPFIFSRCFF